MLMDGPVGREKGTQSRCLGAKGDRLSLLWRWQFWRFVLHHAPGLLALAAGVIPCVPGLLATAGLLEATPFWTNLYHYAWFLSFGTSFLVYAGLTARRQGRVRVATRLLTTSKGRV